MKLDVYKRQDQNFVKDGTSEISGDITFNANVKRTDSSSEKETVTIGNISVDIDFSKNTEQKSDLSVNKSHSDYNADTSSITYNIDITTVNGTGDVYKRQYPSCLQKDLYLTN